ncbi:histidyl-tRNA synthetase family protein, putative (macronuclear) [Tetrahymena thermophila SB210]|uniref:Histidyl-tRNA synthetase family protein, putative n=1 Tax=Tetrahymena thermophila (strain SB210) TaxID=312017 RepID=W7XIP4_TETTS|nr:histidyl-tRNA synthetase family protein, putative [Tetrahymena thermophila SB210]EWS74791.1 histidyl-tRNA synthetase family protein, putative [Tetrahymena thermophila SB210]|eukprot:XP_012652684.1 histidyl-tRNA synthetase family protein, putative [Tetrahymena thermophila SB210]
MLLQLHFLQQLIKQTKQKKKSTKKNLKSQKRKQRLGFFFRSTKESKRPISNPHKKIRCILLKSLEPSSKKTIKNQSSWLKKMIRKTLKLYLQENLPYKEEMLLILHTKIYEKGNKSINQRYSHMVLNDNERTND